MKTQEKKACKSFKNSNSSKFSSVHKDCRFDKLLIFFEQKYGKLLFRVWKLSNWKERPEKSAWKCPYGHLKRSFDKPSDFFFLRFRSFLAQNPRTIKKWGSFQRELSSSVRRFRRTGRKPFWQKWRNSSNKVCKFSIFFQIFLNYFLSKKVFPGMPLRTPSVHVYQPASVFLSRIAKTKFAQSHKTFENWKIDSTQQKIAIKTSSKHVVCSFANLSPFWAKSVSSFRQALTIQKTGNFQKGQNCSSAYVKYSFERSSSQSSKQFWKHRKKRPAKVLKIQILQSFPQYTKIVDLTSCWYFLNKSTGKLLFRVWKLSNWKERPEKSAWKCPYGHLKRSFDKPSDFFFLRFRSFLAQNPRTIKRWGSFQRKFYSSVRRFRRTRRKQFWQKWRNSSNKVCSFCFFLQIFLKSFLSKKVFPGMPLRTPSVHVYQPASVFLSRIAKTKFAQSHKTFENRKIHSTQKKLLSKLPLNRSFAVLRTCWLSGPKVCHRSGQALKIQKTGTFNKKTKLFLRIGKL